MAISDSQSNQLLKIAAWGLQTIGGILLCIIGYLVWDCYKTIQDHEKRIVRVETNADNAHQSVEEIKQSIERMNTKLDRMLELMARKAP